MQAIKKSFDKNVKDDVMIGLEVHVQLTKLRTKLFCSCSSNYRSTGPNETTCPTCLGLPGALPVISKKAVEFAIKLALALESSISKSMYFFRKHYFYPDLPKGFQVTQYNKSGGVAFAKGGKISIRIRDQEMDVKINRIHLEEDPARLVHKFGIEKSPYTLVNYNRSGIALIEIVTEPDMKAPEEAREFLTKLRSIIDYIEISDLDLEGSCRVDANISISGHLRCEIKGIESVKDVERALRWEIQRQRNVLRRGKNILQETRHWDEKRKITVSMRIKETEKDYRYFPEQNLVPIEINKDFIEEVKRKLPELPDAKRIRFRSHYKLSDFSSNVMVLDKDVSDFFEQGIYDMKEEPESSYYPTCQQYAHWLIGDVARWLRKHKKTLKETNLTPKELKRLVISIQKGEITGKIAKTFISGMMKGISVHKLIEQTDKTIISDEKEIIIIAKKIIANYPDIVKDAKTKPRAIEALIGRCMQLAKDRLDPIITRKVVLKLLRKS